MRSSDQVETLLQYFPVFDKLRKEFFVGEMIWNFADFMTQQGKNNLQFVSTCKVVISSLLFFLVVSNKSTELLLYVLSKITTGVPHFSLRGRGN